MSVQTVVEWMTDQNTCFLLGAGCSLCAGKPNIDQLTEKVCAGLSSLGQETLCDLKGGENRPANIENLMNYLLRARQLKDARKSSSDEGDWTISAIDEELLRIKKEVLGAIGMDWTPSRAHQQFLARIASNRPRKPVDIFCLNYDTVLEASMEAIKLRYSDGFTGSENASFEPATFDEAPDGVPFFRIHKLHGSVNWVRDADDTVRRHPARSLGDAPRLVIYPAEQKYVETKYGIYEVLMRRFRERLRSGEKNNKLVVLGYSFADEHINLAIEDSINNPHSNLTVHAFVGPEDDVEAQKTRFTAMAERCDHRFSAVIGDCHHVGPALDNAGWTGICGRSLWKFEKLAALMAGVANE